MKDDAFHLCVWEINHCGTSILDDTWGNADVQTAATRATS